jgi:ribosomal protein S18 acetylase RimI-like enzyme
VKLLLTYMEVRTAPAGAPLPRPDGSFTLEAERLSLEAYVALYRAIGDPYQWDQRLRMPPDALAALLALKTTIALVLREEGRAIGLCEFDVADAADIELTHFGLIPEVYGRRLGPFLLDSGLRAMWTAATQRIWLHTDTNDHPKAQATYERAGFKPYLQQYEEFPD